MGYYNRLEVELQHITDPHLREIVEWKRAHEHMLTGEELWDIMTDEKKQDAALARWRMSKDLPSPKPASEHVALQVTRRQLRPRQTYATANVWLLVACAVLLGVSIVVVAL